MALQKRVGASTQPCLTPEAVRNSSEMYAVDPNLGSGTLVKRCDESQDKHRMTVKAALDASIARQKAVPSLRDLEEQVSMYNVLDIFLAEDTHSLAH